MSKAVLLVDGENFQYKVKQVLESNNLKDKKNIVSIKFSDLIEKVFSMFDDIEINEKRYYSAKIHFYKQTSKKSKELIYEQRILKTNLEKQGFKFILSGHVRANIVNKKSKQTVFKEKGVDVKIAVDMVTIACDKSFDKIILCSSDSDLQPAVKESRKRGIEVIYLGFSINPNKGLTFTTNQTVLFRNPEIVNSIPSKE